MFPHVNLDLLRFLWLGLAIRLGFTLGRCGRGDDQLPIVAIHARAHAPNKASFVELFQTKGRQERVLALFQQLQKESR